MTLQDVDCISLIESLARLLRKHSGEHTLVEIFKTPRNTWTRVHTCTGVKNVLPITTAKVPIVKFYHVQTGLEGDISLYNTLVELFHLLFSDFCHFSVFELAFVFLLNMTVSFQALHNTHLLASYAAIDQRVKILCYIMKVFAKVSMFCMHIDWNIHDVVFQMQYLFSHPLPSQMCDIGDASRGSLSSYAYTLMALFFLQQRNPPVIPVLQEVRLYHCILQAEIHHWAVH